MNIKYEGKLSSEHKTKSKGESDGNIQKQP